MTNTVFLAGASRGVGKEVVKCLIAQNYQVKALLRSDASRAELEAMGIEVVLGDAMNLDEVKAVMSGGKFDAVISTIGGLPQDTVKPDYLGNKNLIDVAVSLGVKKFILVSSIGAGNSVSSLSPQALAALQPVLIEKDKAEEYLVSSELIYTIIRPGGLKSESATGNGVLTEDIRAVGSINRADVAVLVCRALISDGANNKILSAVDKNMLFGQVDFQEFSLV
jgi:uncharacterized protein YbjT (DUF2867 family)